MATTRIYPQQIETRFPLAIAALGLTADEVEDTDYTFHVDSKGVLFCESSDEQMAFRFHHREWTETKFPLAK